MSKTVSNPSKADESNEPNRRNNHGEPICDECGLTVVDRENSDFGDGCLCQGCQAAYRRELELEFGSKILTDGGQQEHDTENDDASVELSRDGTAGLKHALNRHEEYEISRQYVPSGNRQLNPEHREIAVEALRDAESHYASLIGKSTLFDPDDNNVTLGWIRAALDDLDVDYEDTVTDGGIVTDDIDVPAFIEGAFERAERFERIYADENTEVWR
ncbi:hypothetical protein [Halocatena halophila]|uniref:hypothetical protein n=1 Tax=Halocatena halophila TaxID=2814576 RepID=UPI002ED5A4CA